SARFWARSAWHIPPSIPLPHCGPTFHLRQTTEHSATALSRGRFRTRMPVSWAEWQDMPAFFRRRTTWLLSPKHWSRAAAQFFVQKRSRYSPSANPLPKARLAHWDGTLLPPRHNLAASSPHAPSVIWVTPA